MTAMDIWLKIADILFLPIMGFMAWVGKKWVDDRISKASKNGVLNVDVDMKTHIEDLKHDLITEIQRATYPISPTANGGKSLPDVAEKLEKVLDNQGKTQERLGRLEGILETHLQFHYNG